MGMCSENYSGDRCSDCTWADNMEKKLKENPSKSLLNDDLFSSLFEKYNDWDFIYDIETVGDQCTIKVTHPQTCLFVSGDNSQIKSHHKLKEYLKLKLIIKIFEYETVLEKRNENLRTNI